MSSESDIPKSRRGGNGCLEHRREPVPEASHLRHRGKIGLTGETLTELGCIKPSATRYAAGLTLGRERLKQLERKPVAFGANEILRKASAIFARWSTTADRKMVSFIDAQCRPTGVRVDRAVQPIARRPTTA